MKLKEKSLNGKPLPTVAVTSFLSFERAIKNETEGKGKVAGYRVTDIGIEIIWE